MRTVTNLLIARILLTVYRNKIGCTMDTLTVNSVIKNRKHFMEETEIFNNHPVKNLYNLVQGQKH